MAYQTNIFDLGEESPYFRRVIFSGDKTQLMVMDIKPGEDIGEEVYDHVEQVWFFLSGSGRTIMDGEESEVQVGDVVVVTPGTYCNFVNSGDEPTKIFIIAAPPFHIEGRIQRTKDEALADQEDEEFSESVE